jgi:hypothetical protein
MDGLVECRRAWASSFALACLVAVTSSCGGGLSSSDSGAPGICSAGVAAGQACNTIANVATLITPTCTTGTMPTGTGGVIVDGTYVLTAQTYYSPPNCPTAQLSETIEIAGDCFQVAIGGFTSGSGSAQVTTQGNTITVTPTCSNSGLSSGTRDAPAKTYTATDTTVTIYTLNTGTSSPNPDRVEVLTRR